MAQPSTGADARGVAASSEFLAAVKSALAQTLGVSEGRLTVTIFCWNVQSERWGSCVERSSGSRPQNVGGSVGLRKTKRLLQSVVGSFNDEAFSLSSA